MAYPRPCNRCGKKFQPNSPQHKLCYNCLEKSVRYSFKKKPNSRKNKLSLYNQMKRDKYYHALYPHNHKVLRNSEIMNILGFHPNTDFTSTIPFRERWFKQHRKFHSIIVLPQSLSKKQVTKGKGESSK